MSEEHPDDSMALEATWNTCEMSFGCVAVQWCVLSLAQAMTNRDIASRDGCRTECLAAVDEVRGMLNEHARHVEASAGVADADAGQYVREICRLCQEHSELADCLEQVSCALCACDKDADALAIERVRTCGQLLGLLMRRHQETIRNLHSQRRDSQAIQSSPASETDLSVRGRRWVEG
jgi:hypothetical protein